jgi:SAM-dependent methyltransferase
VAKDTGAVQVEQVADGLEIVRSCALCGSADVRPLDAAFGFRRCGACGFVFDSPRPTPGEIESHYSAPGQYDGWLAVDRARDRLAERRLRKLLPHARPGSLLDVGAGIGQLLHHARPHFTRVAGTEVSASAVEHARARYGLELAHGRLEDLDLGTFDNVTLVHVLEHVQDPLRLLRRCRESLRPGGMLLVCVPNDLRSWTSRLRAVRARLAGGRDSPVVGLPRVLATDEIHLSHFTSATLRAALGAAGFEVARLDVDPYWAATGLRGAVHAANYHVHRLLRLGTYQALWAVAYRT